MSPGRRTDADAPRSDIGLGGRPRRRFIGRLAPRPIGEVVGGRLIDRRRELGVAAPLAAGQQHRHLGYPAESRRRPSRRSGRVAPLCLRKVAKAPCPDMDPANVPVTLREQRRVTAVVGPAQADTEKPDPPPPDFGRRHHSLERADVEVAGRPHAPSGRMPPRPTSFSRRSRESCAAARARSSSSLAFFSPASASVASTAERIPTSVA